jgi:hypothetical protein
MKLCGRSFAIAVAALGVASCGGSEDGAGPGDVTVSEAKALDEAAEMIESRLPPEPVERLPAPLPPNPPLDPSSEAPR